MTTQLRAIAIVEGRRGTGPILTRTVTAEEFFRAWHPFAVEILLAPDGVKQAGPDGVVRLVRARMVAA